MFAKTFIISTVVSYAKTGVCGGVSGFAFVGMHRWQTCIQASIPCRINSVRPKSRSEKPACLLNACERNDSYCNRALLSDSTASGEFLNLLLAFFFSASPRVLWFSDEHFFQILPLSMVRVFEREAVRLLALFLR